jgi:protein-disulfide isomerase
MCANAQKRFWDFHDMIFANWLGENVGSFTDARLRIMAQKLDLNMSDFDSCYKAKTYSQQIQDDLASFKNKGQSSTPAIFIDGTKAVASAGENYIPSVEDLSAIIDAALAK